MTNYDKVDIEISNIIAQLNEKLAKQHLQEQMEEQSQKLYENIADDIKEINGVKKQQ